MPRHRVVRILLFPVLAITFMIGWVMYSVGGRHPPKPAKKHASSPKNAPDLEMGLLAEFEEKPLTAED